MCETIKNRIREVCEEAFDEVLKGYYLSAKMQREEEVEDFLIRKNEVIEECQDAEDLSLDIDALKAEYNTLEYDIEWGEFESKDISEKIELMEVIKDLSNKTSEELRTEFITEVERLINGKDLEVPENAVIKAANKYFSEIQEEA